MMDRSHRVDARGKNAKIYILRIYRSEKEGKAQEEMITGYGKIGDERLDM